MEVLTLLLLTLPFGWSMPAEWSSWSPVGSQDGNDAVGSQDGNDASTADSGDVVDDLIDGVPDGGLAAPGDSQDSPGIGLSVPGLGPIGGLGLLGGGAALATIAGIAASTGFAGVGIANAIHKQTNKLKTKFGFANTNKLKTKFGLPLKYKGETFDVLQGEGKENFWGKGEDGGFLEGKDKHDFGAFLEGKDKMDKMGNAKSINKLTNKLKTKFGFANTNKLKKKFGFATESISGLLLKDEGKTFNALLKGDGLDKMEKLLSENGEFKLLLEEGGNLVIAVLEGEGKDNFWGKGQDGEHKVLWSTKTAGAGTHFKFQEDGDLVVLDGEKGVVWNSGTGGLGGENLQMTNDGFLTLLGSNGEQIWQSDQNVQENLEIPEMINRVDIQSLLEESPLAMIQEMNSDEMTSQAENFEDLMSDLRVGRLHLASGWSVWSEFAACSATCGPAIKMRERVCIDPANDETMCQGPTAEIFNCDLPICEGWSAWSDVTECSATCGPAVKTRKRTCTDNSNGGLNCLGSSQETVDCDLLDCPEPLEDMGNDGAWSAWSDFTACSASCGSATKSRARTCSHLDPTKNKDQICRGPKEEMAHCNLQDCQVTDGEWSTWSEFGRCSATCGQATKRRERTCTGPEPSKEGGGIPCQGPKENVVDCNLNDCPVDGGWSAWSDFSACSATCGPATKRRGRTCSDPEPSNGGILCQGLNEETLNCDLANCELEGGWSAWSDFGACSATCGMATKRRGRTCMEPEPSDEGIQCQGLNEETINCNLDNCNTIDGGWSAWTDFGACSATCGMATKRRTRTCTQPEPSDGGHACQGLKEEVTHCNFVFC